MAMTRNQLYRGREGDEGRRAGGWPEGV